MEISSHEYPSSPQKTARSGTAPGARANWTFYVEWIKHWLNIHYSL